jgi:glycosyltransferase involved in cell wall biosynthesis
MVPTEALRRQLAGEGFHNVKVVARGVDTVRFNPVKRSEALRQRWGASPDASVVLHVGRLAPEKNLAALLAAYDTLIAAHPKLTFVFVGDGPSRSELERRCPRAIFAGMRSGDDLAAHYASGDVFLFPSTTETFGNVTTEAMASGLAVVAYDYAAAAQLIEHGVSGMLAPVDQTKAFLGMAVELVGNPGAAARMGRQARKLAEQHSWERVVEELERMFLQVFNSHSPMPADSRVPASLSRPVDL